MIVGGALVILFMVIYYQASGALSILALVINLFLLFSTLSMLESELLRMGKGKHDLSAMYVVDHVYREKAEMYYRLHGNNTFAPGGLGHDVLTAIAKWGIVPNNMEPLGKESAASLKDRLEEAMAPFTRHGIPFKDIVRQSLLTPACSLAPLTEDAAEQALELLTDLSAEMRRKYK